MTDHNARQAGLTDERIRAIHRSVPNHHIDFARAIEREVLAAHSADARNGEGVAMTPERINELGRVSFGRDWDERAYGVHTDSARHFAAAIEQEVRALLAARAVPAPYNWNAVGELGKDARRKRAEWAESLKPSALAPAAQADGAMLWSLNHELGTALSEARLPKITRQQTAALMALVNAALGQQSAVPAGKRGSDQ